MILETLEAKNFACEARKVRLKMLSELSKIGLSAEAIYFLDCNNRKEYLQRKAKTKDAKREGENGENEANPKISQNHTFVIKKRNLKESKWQIL